MLKVRVVDHGSAAAVRRGGHNLDTGVTAVTTTFAQRGAEAARARAGSLGSVHRHASAGITAARSTIRLDTGRHPEILGAEFGGARRPTTRQFPPWRGFGRNAGYMLYPALRSLERELGHMIDTVIERSLR